VSGSPGPAGGEPVPQRSVQPGHLGPKPQAKHAQGAQSGGLPRRTGKGLIFLIAGAALLAAALASVGFFDSPSQQSSSGQPQQSRPIGMSLIRPVNPAESEQAIAQLMMSAPDKEKVRTALAEGKMRLGWVTLSDFEDEDGDWVRFMAGGLRQDVRLLHNAYTIAVPYVPGTPVSVMGLIDGGGGDITVAVYVNSARISLRPLKKGETLQIPSP